MSVMYCEYCHKYIDTDYDAEHFDSDGECLEQIIDTMRKNGASEEIIEKFLNSM